MADSDETQTTPMTTSEVMSRLNLSRPTVVYWDDALRPLRVGPRGQRLYSRDVVEAFARDREAKASR